MGIVRRPMGTGSWMFVETYAEYAKLVDWNLQEDRNFEAIAVAGICLDVLLNHMVEGLLLHYADELKPKQIEALKTLQEGRPTAGDIITELNDKYILQDRLLEALKSLNQIRSALVHPIKEGKLKPDAIVPGHVSKEEASKVYQLLCKIIDEAGGVSPQKQKQELDSYRPERSQEK